MAGITQAEADAKLTLWMGSDDAVATGQAYQLPGGRSLTRADVREIRTNISYWDQKVKELSVSGGRRRVRAFIPQD
jgi:hypothetical protein